jgi:hypothetical protein
MGAIRVPKNLMYLTERLPQPNYKTDDNSNYMKKHASSNGYQLPNIANPKAAANSFVPSSTVPRNNRKANPTMKNQSSLKKDNDYEDN